MATRVTSVALSDGRVAVQKTPLEGDRPDREAEGRWLSKAQSPIVVSLAEVESDPCVIRTYHGGQTTLRTDRRDPIETASSLLALARGLVDLHDRGFVHGKLTLDHVIVTKDSVLLCSPSGIDSDPIIDLQACGQMIDQLLDRWLSDGYAIPAKQQWEDLASQLTSAQSPASARRLVRWLGPLVDEPQSPATAPLEPAPKAVPAAERSPKQQRKRKLAALAVGALVAAGSAFFAISPDGPNPGQPVAQDPGLEIVVDGRLFQFDRSAGAAAIAPQECPTQQIAYLDPETAIVWSFSELEADSVGSALAQVPGATSLNFGSAEEGCALWATGPSGVVRLN